MKVLGTKTKDTGTDLKSSQMGIRIKAVTQMENPTEEELSFGPAEIRMRVSGKWELRADMGSGAVQTVSRTSVSG